MRVTSIMTLQNTAARRRFLPVGDEAAGHQIAGMCFANGENQVNAARKLGVLVAQPGMRSSKLSRY
jgi:hypothetical protein